MEYVFKGLLMDVFSYGRDSDLFSKFPQLKLYPEFKEANSLKTVRFNDLMRYIVAVYDRRGLRVYEESSIRRKKIAAGMVNWSLPSGVLLPQAQLVIDGKIPAVNKMAIRYLKLHNNIKYTSLVAMEELYFSMVTKMSDPDGLKKTDYDLFKSLEKDIEDRIADFLNGDTNKQLAGELIEEIEIDSLNLRPEDLAKRIKAGLPILDKFEPYGDYVPKKLRLSISEAK